MKKLILTSLLSTCLLVCLAQVPQGISYQAVAFKSGGEAVTNATVGVKVSILKETIDGSTEYVETHKPKTNAQGLFHLSIGQGTAETGEFASINWGNGSKFLKIEVDPNGGENYTNIGTNQLTSVPYALYAESVAPSGLPNSIKSINAKSELIVVYTETHAYGFSSSSSGSGFWNEKKLTGTVVGAVASNNSIVVYTGTYAYAFYQFNSGSSSWNERLLSSTPVGAIASEESIVVYTKDNAYGFAQSTSTGSGNWETKVLQGTILGSVSSTNLISVYTGTYAYGFYRSSTSGFGRWEQKLLSSSPVSAIGAKNHIVVVTKDKAHAFNQSSSGFVSWNDKTLKGSAPNIISR